MNPFSPAPDDEIARRLALCRVCPHRGVVPLVNTAVCTVCGCPLANKTKFLNSTCPKGQW